MLHLGRNQYYRRFKSVRRWNRPNKISNIPWAPAWGACVWPVLPWHSITRVKAIPCFGHVNVTFVWEPAPRRSRQTCWEASVEEGGKSVTCRCPFVSHEAQEQAGGCQEILLTRSKINAQDLYFLQPDIKKISKHKSIRGENCVFSPPHPALLTFLSVCLSLSTCFDSVWARVRGRVSVRQVRVMTEWSFKTCLYHRTRNVWSQTCIYI